jgi:hypothetical protein
MAEGTQSSRQGECRGVDEMQPVNDLVDGIERYLAAQQSTPDAFWTEEDELLLFHRSAAIAAAHWKGYSEELLHTVLTTLFPRLSDH